MSVADRRCVCGNIASDPWAQLRVREGMRCGESEACKALLREQEREAAREKKAREQEYQDLQARKKAEKKARYLANKAARAEHNKSVAGEPGRAAKIPGRGW